MGSCTSTVLRKNVMVINVVQSCMKSQFSINFLCTVSKIQNTSHPNVLANRKSYEHNFAKKM
ncbi:hypothetical protein B296_00042954 [Ensete ventricosum]|uniref:Uncharacterized protein n=1 Tax=Ensete ventricosum TaxID=4639 RepID=A0A426XBQ0_ENSVE|nr:hypothetical protein B296_00042954 [Ensete ventricosum]